MQIDGLAVRVYGTRAEMGAAAAAQAAGVLREMLAGGGPASAIFAAAPSQNEFLSGLRAAPGIEWGRLRAFHLDEYVGMAADHPASFRLFLRERLFDHVAARFEPLRGDAPDPDAECIRYAALLAGCRPGLAALGIGENGHLAFIDPPVCDFSDPLDVRVVTLDEACRAQQVHDGAFARSEDVPRQALSVTIPLLMRIPSVVVVAPGASKRSAVRDALEGGIGPACPASILRRHPGATLFLDGASAGLLRPRSDG